MINVAVRVQTSDNDPNPSCVITKVTSNQPVNGTGDGDTSPDARIEGSTVLLRAERRGQGNGRVYSICFTATILA